jgi:hypothetical protein
MPKDAESEERAHPYRPKPICSQRERCEGDEEEHINDEHSKFYVSPSTRVRQENDVSRRDCRGVCGGPYSFWPTTGDDGVGRAKDQKRDE